MAGVTIIAELGVNHNGDPDLAVRMIQAAAEVGCDGVKVQSFRASDFLPDGHPDWDMFEKCEIWPFLYELADAAHQRGLLFGVTPQVARRVQEAVDAGADYLKVGSDTNTHQGLIRACLDTGLPTWVSTGMWDALDGDEIPFPAKLMLCTSDYPCLEENAKLRLLLGGDSVYSGFSDHTMGHLAAAIAAFCGVEMVEKHFTLNRMDDGPDHSFSADPDEMHQLVDAVRRAEKLRGLTGLSEGERANRDRWRVPEGALRPA